MTPSSVPAAAAAPSVKGDSGDELQPAPARIAELLGAAIAYIERALNYTISVDEDSLAFVDHYVSQVRGGDGDLALRHKDDVVRLVAAALGVHLGEVAIARFGGRWRAIPNSAAGADDPRQDPTAWRVELVAAPVVVDPIGMAVLALRRPDLDSGPSAKMPAAGAAENADAEAGDGEPDPVGFVTRPELSEPLRAALVRIPPVSADYYFSLTGRFETLSYVVDLLIELQQKKAEAIAQASSDQSEEDESEEDEESAGPKAAPKSSAAKSSAAKSSAAKSSAAKSSAAKSSAAKSSAKKTAALPKPSSPARKPRPLPN